MKRGSVGGLESLDPNLQFGRPMPGSQKTDLDAQVSPAIAPTATFTKLGLFLLTQCVCCCCVVGWQRHGRPVLAHHGAKGAFGDDDDFDGPGEGKDSGGYAGEEKGSSRGRGGRMEM
jgi:hypothetical protein